RANRPEAFILKDAAATPDLSRERFASGFGTLAQMLMVAGGAHAIGRPTLSEKLGLERASEAPIAAPIEPVVTPEAATAEPLRVGAEPTVETPTVPAQQPEGSTPLPAVPLNPDNIAQMLGGERKPASWVIKNK